MIRVKHLGEKFQKWSLTQNAYIRYIAKVKQIRA